MRRRGPAGDGGSAVVEFVTLGVLLLVPVVYLVLMLGRVQAAAFAAEAGARAAARAVTASDDEATGRARAGAAVALALRDQAFEPSTHGDELRIACEASPCLTPGARVHTTVTVDVPLPAVPAFVTRVVPSVVTVDAGAVAVVDRFR